MPLEFVDPKRAIGKIEVPQDTSQSHGQDPISEQRLVTIELEAKCRELSAAVRQRRQSYLRWHGVLTAFAIGFGAAVSLLLAFGRPLMNTGLYTVCWVLLACLIVGLSSIGGYLRVTRRSKELRGLLKRVTAADSTLVTGALVDALSSDDTEVAKEARRQLTRLAPRWTEADMASLTEDQRTGLRRAIDGMPTALHGDASGAALGRRYNIQRNEFRAALCTALGRLGDYKDLQTLRSVSGLLGGTLWARPVREAAIRAARELDARLAEQHRPHTLLRASEAPQSSPVELVRAARAPDLTPPEQLLRPGESEK